MEISMNEGMMRNQKQLAGEIYNVEEWLKQINSDIGENNT